MRYDYSREELKDKCAIEYKEGDVIKSGKYFVWISFGAYASPLHTHVSTDSDLRDLPMSKWPYYISDFIHRRRENE